MDRPLIRSLCKVRVAREICNPSCAWLQAFAVADEGERGFVVLSEFAANSEAKRAKQHIVSSCPGHDNPSLSVWECSSIESLASRGELGKSKYL